MEVFSQSCSSSSAASQLVKVVVEKDGHRFCTHVHHHPAHWVRPKGLEQHSNGRMEQQEEAGFPSTPSWTCVLLLLLRASADQGGEAGFLHSAAAQRSPDVLQLLRAHGRSSRSPHTPTVQQCLQTLNQLNLCSSRCSRSS